MTSRKFVSLFAVLVLAIGAGWSYLQVAGAGATMTTAAKQFLASLSDEQKAKAHFAEYDAPQRVGWHFIPKNDRKGLQIRDMQKPQREAAHALLRTTLSELGYRKATQIMQLEHILHVLEQQQGGGRNVRDTERYYFMVFGQPGESRWGLSIEGHHLSLNYVVEGGKVISSTPTFFAANPATVKNEVEGGLKKGTRVLAKEEQLAFNLVNALSEDQRKTAIIAETAPREIRAAGEPQPPNEPAVGVRFGELTPEQQNIMKQLVGAYVNNMPDEVHQARVDAIVAAGPDNVHFAWAGATKPGVGHYYRIQGPTFLVEFVNTQPDPAGNPANHIHCVWRDMHGDFAIPIE